MPSIGFRAIVGALGGGGNVVEIVASRRGKSAFRVDRDGERRYGAMAL